MTDMHHKRIDENMVTVEQWRFHDNRVTKITSAYCHSADARRCSLQDQLRQIDERPDGSLLNIRIVQILAIW